MASTAEILEQALQLAEKDRAKVAYELLRSLDDDRETNPIAVQAAWTAELDRRIEEIDRGTAELMSLDDVKGRIAEARAERRKP